MLSFNEIITFDSRNEHDLEHDLKIKKKFSAPKIYDASGDLTKRWYVYFSFRNPTTGKLERMKNIYGKANQYKSKEDRIAVLSIYRNNLLKLLNEGYSPFKDNSELYQKNATTKLRKSETLEVAPLSLQTEKASDPVIKAHESDSEDYSMTLEDAFAFALQLKLKTVAPRTLKDYQNKVTNFLKWIAKQYPDITTVDRITKKVVQQFLNDVLRRTSARSRNNYRIDLGSLMQALEDNEIMSMNFMKKIPILKSTPQRNKTYTTAIQEKIFEYLEKEDPILLLYIKFISYNFLRPVEVNRLKIGDINFANNTLSFKAKNSPLKTKLIPEILLDELPNLEGLGEDLFLFTPSKIGGNWDATEINRRDHFTKRFKEVVKNHYGLDKNYGLYSFRHTYITKLYRSMVKNGSPFEAKSRLMLITGHSSMSALEKYLRDIDAQLPEDYSALIK